MFANGYFIWITRAPDMASLTCWRCITKAPPYHTALQIAANPMCTSLRSCIIPANAFFSTSSRPAASNDAPRKGTNTLRIAKKTPILDKGKPPAIGERKAMRKRIILTNNNALEVDLPVIDKLTVDRLANTLLVREKPHKNKKHNTSRNKEQSKNSKESGPKTETAKPEQEPVGRVFKLPEKTIDSLRAIDAFKITQSWSLFRHPAVLIRKESKSLTERLVQAMENKSTIRMMIDGARGTGKSMMLLHAMTVAFLNDWIVINIPEAQEITNAVTEYAPIPNSDLFSQNNFMSGLLKRIANANSQILNTLRVRFVHTNLPAPLPPDCTLLKLCELGSLEIEYAWLFFSAFWSEIIAEKNPPIMMCLDGLSYILQDSLYQRPDLSRIHSHDLAIVRHFIDYLSGEKSLLNGGIFLAATNRSHAPTSPTLELCIKRFEERAQEKPESRVDPYGKKYDARSAKILQNLEVFKLAGLSKNEARGLLEYWAKSGVVKFRIDEQFVAEKWAVAGHGNVGELERCSLWMRI